MITSPTEITEKWLTDRLRENGYLHQGEVSHVTMKLLESHATGAVALSVELGEGSVHNPPVQLVCKLYNGNDFWPGWAEVTFYTELATEMVDFAIPQCYAAEADMDHVASYLLLEDVSATHRSQPATSLTFEQYQNCVDELAQLHAHWWEHPHLSTDYFMHPHGGPLRMAQAIKPEAIRQNGMALQESLPEILGEVDTRLTWEQRVFCEQAVTAWPDLFIERTSDSSNIAMIHGDYHCYGNIWLPYRSSERIKILDWETWKRGIGTYDLAYLLAYEVDTRRQWERPLLEHYHLQLASRGIDYSWEQCLADYRLSLIACLFPPMMWSNEDALHAALCACEDWYPSLAL